MLNITLFALPDIERPLVRRHFWGKAAENNYEQIDLLNINSSRYIEKHELDAYSKNIKHET